MKIRQQTATHCMKAATSQNTTIMTSADAMQITSTLHSECESVNHFKSNKKGSFCLTNTKNIFKEFYFRVTVLHRNQFLYNKTNQMHQFRKFILS